MIERFALRVADAQAIGGDVYHRHRLTVRAGEPFGMRLRAVDWHGIVIGSLEYAGRVRIEADAFGDSYQVNLTSAGAVRLLCDDHEAVATPGRAVVHGPDRPTVIEGWARPARMLGVKLARRDVEQRVRPTLDACGVAELPAATIDLDSGSGRDWVTLVQRVRWWYGADDDPLLDRTLLDGTFATLALALAGHPRPVAWRAEASRSTVAGASAVAQSAARLAGLLHARAASGIGIAEIAHEAGVGVRTVEKHIGTAYGVTPSTLLRDIRLASVRRDLELRRAERPTSCGIRGVATKWGFTNGGRFSAAYRKRYGELPSATVGRRQRRQRPHL